MSIKRTVFGVLAATTMTLSMAGAASASPPEHSHANCTGLAASAGVPISESAHQSDPFSDHGNFVSGASRNNCVFNIS